MWQFLFPRAMMSRLRVFIASFLLLMLPLSTQAQNAVLPKPVKVKRGLTLSLSLLTPLDSAHARVGDDVSAQLVRPLLADGQTVLPSGWIVHGTVTKMRRAGKNCHNGEIKWKLTSVVTPRGERLEVRLVDSYPVNYSHIGDPEQVSLDTKWNKTARTIRRVPVYIGEAVLFTALSPFFIPLAIAVAGENRCSGEAGHDLVLDPGKGYLYAVSKDTRIAIVR